LPVLPRMLSSLFVLCATWLALAGNANAAALTYPPQNRGGKQPVFVYLHGIAGTPERGCREFARSVNMYGWLVCPQANIKDKNGAFSWGGTTQEQWQTVRSAIEGISAEPEVDAKAPVVLLGFSLGAYAAANFIRNYPKQIRAALFVGADIRFSKEELAKAGVGKVGCAAGEMDGTYVPLKNSCTALSTVGYPAQFRTLGHVGHTYFGENEALAIDSLVSWLGGD
jgi:dienelactone hydrolase